MALKHWQSKTAFFMALSMATTTTLPVLLSAPAQAGSAHYRVSQLLEQRIRYSLPSGTEIPVRYDEAERIIIKPDETAEVTLVVASDVRDQRGRVVIPRGSQIEGELRPQRGGTQFVSEQIVFDEEGDRTQTINATSSVITDTQVLDEKSDPDLVRGAAIGAAAAAVLSEVFGSIDVLEVLGGAGLGALASILLGGGSDEAEVVIIEPDTDLDLALQSEFVLDN